MASRRTDASKLSKRRARAKDRDIKRASASAPAASTSSNTFRGRVSGPSPPQDDQADARMNEEAAPGNGDEDSNRRGDDDLVADSSAADLLGAENAWPTPSSNTTNTVFEDVLTTAIRSLESQAVPSIIPTPLDEDIQLGRAISPFPEGVTASDVLSQINEIETRRSSMSPSPLLNRFHAHSPIRRTADERNTERQARDDLTRIFDELQDQQTAETREAADFPDDQSENEGDDMDTPDLMEMSDSEDEEEDGEDGEPEETEDEAEPGEQEGEERGGRVGEAEDETEAIGSARTADDPTRKNDPDPFADRSREVPSARSIHDLHPNRLAALAYMTVTWLHQQQHLPFLACSALLAIFSLIFWSCGVVLDPPLITTLAKVHVALELDVPFQILPVCPNEDCRRVYPDTDITPPDCPRCGTPLFRPPVTSKGKRQRLDTRVPELQYPFLSVSSQLPGILACDGVEEMLDAWRYQPDPPPGLLRDISDGRIWKTVKGEDGLPFFRSSSENDSSPPDGELRIGLTMGLDWFSYLRSNISSSHTSCPMSFCLAQLPPHLRYRTANLMLTGIMPGPKEQDPDQVQDHLRPLVSDLLRLWKHGLKIPTPSCPEGRLVRVALVAVVCDKPAAHKISGFGSHSHTYFCTRCWISTAEKQTGAAFEAKAFQSRTNAEQRELGQQYCRCNSATAREKFVKKNATRYSELSRLPYFDLVRMTVVDPMHNLILGLVKTHFYHIWVNNKVLRKSHELRQFHELLKKVEVPSSLGKLPDQIGIPAGGSLTADQWLLLGTIIGPIVIPQLWQDCMSMSPEDARTARIARIAQAEAAETKRKVAQAQRRKAKAQKTGQAVAPTEAGETDGSHSTREAPSRAEPSTATSEQSSRPAPTRPTPKRRRNADTGETEEDQDADDSNAPFSLHPDDPEHFMKLSSALHLLFRKQITIDSAKEADRLLRAYCRDMIKLYGKAAVRPNHHYATHTLEFILDFGPLYGFWTYLFERLNRTLKSYKTSNGKGGELEVTFFREFHRTSQASRLVHSAATSNDPVLHEAAYYLQRASQDDRGTLRNLAQRIDDDLEDEGHTPDFSMSRMAKTATLDSRTLSALLHFYRSFLPMETAVHTIHTRNRSPNSRLLPSTAMLYDHFVLNGRKVVASSRSRTAQSSLVEVRTGEGETDVGEVEQILESASDGLPRVRCAVIRWFDEFDESLPQCWEQASSLSVRLWKPDSDLQPRWSSVVELKSVVGHVARMSVTVNNTCLWATIATNRDRHLRIA